MTNEYKILLSNYLISNFSPRNTVVISKFKLTNLKNKFFSIFNDSIDEQTIIYESLSHDFNTILITDSILSLFNIFSKKPLISPKARILIFYVNLNSSSYFELLNSLNADGSFNFLNLNPSIFQAQVMKLPKSPLSLVNLINLDNYEDYAIKTITKGTVNISPFSLIEFYHRKKILAGDLCTKISKSHIRKIQSVKEPNFLKINMPNSINQKKPVKHNHDILSHFRL